MSGAPEQNGEQSLEAQWVPFPGGELEGKRPSVSCPACRAAQPRPTAPSSLAEARNRTVCFQCYRADLDRQRAGRAARDIGLDPAAATARFQEALPFEPVDRSRLARLKVERLALVRARHAGLGQYGHRRRQAQIAARHTLQRLASGLASRQQTSLVDGGLVNVVTIHGVPLPASWLPFVVAR